MPRLIDVDVLIATSAKLVYEEYTGIDERPFEYVPCISMESINNAPTIDPVRHGYWIKSTTKSLEVECVCSVCSGDAPSEYGRYTWIKSEYCPSCGCKMDGDTHD